MLSIYVRNRNIFLRDCGTGLFIISLPFAVLLRRGKLFPSCGTVWRCFYRGRARGYGCPVISRASAHRRQGRSYQHIRAYLNMGNAPRRQGRGLYSLNH